MIDVFIFVVVFSTFIYTFYKWATANNDYFEHRNLKYLKPRFLIGNIGEIYLSNFTAATFSKLIYQKFPGEG